MNKLMLSLGMTVAMALATVVSGTAEASGPKVMVHPKGSFHNTIHPIRPVTPIHNTIHPVFSSNYHQTHGHRFSHGYYFQGREFRHFRYRHWDSHYRCWTFYYPGTSCYYYWSGSNGCYYPLSYAPVVAPNGVLPDDINTLPVDQMP